MCEEEDEGKDCLSLERTCSTILAPRADLVSILPSLTVATIAVRSRTRQARASADRTSGARGRACFVAVGVCGAGDAGTMICRSRHI